MKNYKNIVLLILIAFSFLSCSKWLDIKPADRIVEEHVFDSEAGFLSALNGIYNELLKTELYGSALGNEFIEILGQQYSIRPLNVNYTEAANFSYRTVYTKGRLEGIWDASFRAILNCNKIIENAHLRPDVMANKPHAVITGEAVALRAFLHFDMLRLFGPIYKINSAGSSIPYMDKISVSPFPLLTAEEAAARIIQDLTTAEELLIEQDPILVDGPQTNVVEGLDNTYRFRTLRFNYYAVLALKARVYLYMGDKVNALKYAKLVIDDPKRVNYFPFVNYSEILGNAANPDRIFSTEVLFGLYNSKRNTVFQTYFNPDASQASNLLIPRAGNIAALYAGEENDYRNFPIWKNSSLEANTVYSTKYKAGETLTLYRNNIMPLLRLGELYLIAAESESDVQASYAYLNVLRAQRGLPSVTDNLVARIRSEYVKEFFGEGQLFFFYKRLNTSQVRSGITNNNINMTAAQYVPLLPDSENRYRN